MHLSMSSSSVFGKQYDFSSSKRFRFSAWIAKFDSFIFANSFSHSWRIESDAFFLKPLSISLNALSLNRFSLYSLIPDSVVPILVASASNDSNSRCALIRLVSSISIEIFCFTSVARISILRSLSNEVAQPPSSPILFQTSSLCSPTTLLDDSSFEILARHKSELEIDCVFVFCSSFLRRSSSCRRNSASLFSSAILRSSVSRFAASILRCSAVNVYTDDFGPLIAFHFQSQLLFQSSNQFICRSRLPNVNI